MKKFLLILGVLMTVPAFADSAKSVVGTFNGKLSIESESLDIKVVQIEIVNQFCNFWGTTCAGGPKDVELLHIITSESENGKIISIAHESQTDNSSLKVGNRFSSCKVNLIVEGVNAEGKIIGGQVGLAWVNDKKVCASKEQLTKMVRESLVKTLVVKDNGYYLSIK